MGAWLLFVSHVSPLPVTAGNEMRLYRLLKAVRGAGYRAALLLAAAPAGEAVDAVSDCVDELWFSGDGRGVPWQGATGVLHHALARCGASGMNLWRRLEGHCLLKPARLNMMDDFAPNRLFCTDEVLLRTWSLCRRLRPVAVIAEYFLMTPCLGMAGENTLRLVDTHDVFSEKRRIVEAMGIDDRTTLSEEEERRYLSRADVLIAIQEDEARQLRELVPGRRVVTAGVDFDVVTPTGRPVEPPRVLVVGSDNAMNRHAMNALMTNVWPAVNRRRPDTVLRLVGGISTPVAHQGGVEKVPRAADLAGEYAAATLVVNPTLAGTGLKVKSVEALCHGKCLVTTKPGVLGLPGEPDAPWVECVDSAQMVTALLDLMQDAERRARMERRALEFARKVFGADRVYRDLLAVLGATHRGRG